jgi:hypothetical protein
MPSMPATTGLTEIYSNLDRSEFFVAWCSGKGPLDLALSDVRARPRHLLGSDVGGYSLRLLPLTDEEYLVVWVRRLDGALHIYSCKIFKTPAPPPEHAHQ